MHKNITFLIASLSNGAGTERACISLANQLAEEELSVSIVVLKGGPSFFEVNAQIKIFYLCDVYKGKRTFVLSWFKLHTLLNALSTDVLINEGTELSLLANINIPRQIKIISCEHFTYTRNLTCKKLKFTMWLTKHFASKIVVLTDEDAHNWNNKKVVTIPNSTPFVTDKHADCHTKNVIAVGRLAYIKGFDLLIKAWAGVIKYHSDSILNIYGDGPCKRELNELIVALGLSHHVCIHTPTKNIQAKLFNSSLYVLPSRFEPFGIALIEAMECGLPIVAFKSIGPKSILKDQEDSILVENGDIQQLSTSIIRLLDEESLRADMGARAKDHARRFHIEHIVKRWEELIYSN